MIENPKPSRGNYGTWLAEKPPTIREQLEQIMDATLSGCKDFDSFLAALQAAGVETKRSKHLAFKIPGGKRFTRCSSLSKDYSEAIILERVSGNGNTVPKQKRAAPNLLIDVQARLQQAHSPGFEQWARMFNLKEMAKTLNFLQEHGLLAYANLESACDAAVQKYNSLSDRTKANNARMKEISELQKHVGAYAESREVYAQYRRLPPKKQAEFYDEHTSKIISCEAAKQFFDSLGLKKLPSVQSLKQEYAVLLAENKKLYPEQKKAKTQYPAKRPGGSVPYRIVYRSSAMYPDGSAFTDHDVHRALKRRNIPAVGGEWFRCTVEDVKAAVLAVRTRSANLEGRTAAFPMRPEQQAAVEKAAAYFRSVYAEDPSRRPKFLWNCKMRFGKTFAAYQLAKKMDFRRVLVLTFKPAVVSAWREDLQTHMDFEGWQFISRDTELTYERADKDRPIVCFGSFQDYLGVNRETGGIKAKNEWVHTTNWDLVIFDEYHFGAWKDSAKNLFEQEDEDSYDSEAPDQYCGDACDETWLPITASFYLYLSGTPFRALNSGEFIEEQVYNWTYSDEQRAKTAWQGEDNPYAALPRMVLMTYRIPDSIRQIALQGEFNEFDLNLFFSAGGKGKEARFVYENEVQKWLDLIRGAYLETTVDNLKLGAKKPALPYADARLLNVLQHTLWFLPNVAACHAMRNLLAQRQNAFYHSYTVNVCAGSDAGIGAAALEPVLRSMEDPLETKTITLSCGKLTTGVTVKPWTGIFMLRNLSSPETYFQAAFRVQSPWEVAGDGGRREIIKQECYVFDFALDRALRQISDYSCRLNLNEDDPEKKVAEFISFLPVIAYDGSSMRQISAGEVLDIAMAGTSATLLAKRWESALLVNVDNGTLARLLANPEAMDALMRIEGFRSLNADIQTIINKSEAVKKAKKDGADRLTEREKKELTEAEKEYKSKRKQIQEKLIKFATRIPIFMYLTDYREKCLKDVITQLEPGLFKKVTGLSVRDFELLVSLGLFNDALMNDAVYKFKRYEDASLTYTGIDRHDEEEHGGWDTVISDEDYHRMFSFQQASMDAPKPVVVPLSKENKLSEKAAITPTPKTIPAWQNRPSVKPAAKSVDISSIRLGSSLQHKAFGLGTVTALTDKRIAVAFEISKKTFVFPNAVLSGFLSIPE